VNMDPHTSPVNSPVPSTPVRGKGVMGRGLGNGGRGKSLFGVGVPFGGRGKWPMGGNHASPGTPIVVSSVASTGSGGQTEGDASVNASVNVFTNPLLVHEENMPFGMQHKP
jgi:hypothetical protein